jgi:hypothetical protein
MVEQRESASADAAIRPQVRLALGLAGCPLLVLALCLAVGRAWPGSSEDALAAAVLLSVPGALVAMAVAALAATPARALLWLVGCTLLLAGIAAVAPAPGAGG